MKSLFDRSLALAGLVVLSPILLGFALLVWLQDWGSPLYVALRVGQNNKEFKMFKMRSMVLKADRSGVDSTSSNDIRVTPIGRIIRQFKIDELMQLLNVVSGSMSLVGPRPNVIRETNLYTEKEKALLSVRPGITDFSSIVFSDEAEILEGSVDPDISYNQLIRPTKSELGLFYIKKQSFILDVQIIILTIVSIVSRRRALKGVCRLLLSNGADKKLVKAASREHPLRPSVPPGGSEIVTTRDNSK